MKWFLGLGVLVCYAVTIPDMIVNRREIIRGRIPNTGPDAKLNPWTYNLEYDSKGRSAYDWQVTEVLLLFLVTGLFVFTQILGD